MTTKIAGLFADLDALAFNIIDVDVTCITSSRRYIYFRVTVSVKRNGREFSACYEGSDLNHQQISGHRWAAYFTPKLEKEIAEIIRARTYRANSNVFRALRGVADAALASTWISAVNVLSLRNLAPTSID